MVRTRFVNGLNARVIIARAKVVMARDRVITARARDVTASVSNLYEVWILA
jgi:hypothetical protein